MKKFLAFVAAGVLLTAGRQLALADDAASTLAPTALPPVNVSGAATATERPDGTVRALTANGEALELTATDYAVTNDLFSTPPDGVMLRDDAFSIAIEAVMEKYGETLEGLGRFTVHYGFAKEDAHFRTPYWQFDLSQSDDPKDAYEILVHAKDGEVLHLIGGVEGNG